MRPTIDLLSALPDRTGVMTQRSEIEISNAIQECARLCLPSDDPTECARDYIAKLTADGWVDDDTREVLIGVLRVMAQLLHHYRDSQGKLR